MPPVTPEAVSIRRMSQALVTVLGRRKGEEFLREWSRLSLLDEEMENIFPLRPEAQRPAVVKARRQSHTWLRVTMPLMVASLKRR